MEPVGPLPFPLAARLDPQPRLCVIVPAYNEEAVLAETFTRIASTLDTLGADWQVLFVNDGSRDTTPLVLDSLYREHERVSYILLSRNFGHQAALTAGLDHADADLVVTMDADLQHPPELLSVLYEGWRRGYDVIHTRKLSTEALGTVRAIVTRVAYGLIARVSDVEIVPHASDYRLLDREALMAVRQLPERARLYRGLTPWVGFRQGVVSFRAGRRAGGTSQYGLKQLASLFARAFFDFSSAPLHVGLVLGALTVGLSLIYLVVVLAVFLAGISIPKGYASIIFIVTLLSSINLTFSGILGVYIARIYNEVRERPTYVVSRMRTHLERTTDASLSRHVDPPLT